MKKKYFDANSTEACSKLTNDNKLAMVQVTAWHRTGDKPLPGPIMTDFFHHHMARRNVFFHYNDVMMSAIASSITSLTIVYSTAY